MKIATRPFIQEFNVADLAYLMAIYCEMFITNIKYSFI